MKTLRIIFRSLVFSLLLFSCDKECIPVEKHFILDLQLNDENGKDAVFSKIAPDNNYGEIEDIHLFAWTHEGIPNVNRVAIDFDLSSIPSEAKIDSAKLSLYFNKTSAYGNQHQGRNDFIIQRITTGWEETTITWRTQPSATSDNQVFVGSATLPTQDIPDINITQLIRDYCQEKNRSFGFLLKLLYEEPYKVLLLASSEHTIEEIRPNLMVYYTLIE